MFKKVSSWLASFLELQLIISLLSLPVLIHWGLGVSCMLPLANIIFTPLLALFLWCSCIFAICTTIHIPCQWLVIILDILAHIWHYLLSFAQPSWLIGFHHQMLWLATMIALFLIFIYTFFYPNKKQSLILLISCCCLILAIKWMSQKNCFFKVKNLPLYVLQLNNKTFLIDNGALCSKQNFYSWIDYTILPALIKTGGITTIDTLVLYKPSKKLIPVVKQFAQQAMIKTILVTTKHGSYYELKEALTDSSIKIVPIYKKF